MIPSLLIYCNCQDSNPCCILPSDNNHSTIKPLCTLNMILAAQSACRLTCRMFRRHVIASITDSHWLSSPVSLRHRPPLGWAAVTETTATSSTMMNHHLSSKLHSAAVTILSHDIFRFTVIVTWQAFFSVLTLLVRHGVLIPKDD